MARRKSDQRKVCNDFYIITNGAQTEKNYFDLLKAKHSVYSVHVKFKNADPLDLVEYAKDFLNTALTDSTMSNSAKRSEFTQQAPFLKNLPYPWRMKRTQTSFPHTI